MIVSQDYFEYFIAFVALIYLYDFYLQKSAQKYLFIAKNPKYTALDPYDETSVKNVNLNYSKLVDMNNFNFLLNPKVCGEESLLVIIVVSTSPDHYERRAAIRETWGRTNDAVKLVFTLGETSNTAVARNISKESNQFGDIVQGNFVDSYRNLTYKHVMGLKWVAHHCNKARYLIKSDDDTFVHHKNLMKFLVRELSPWGAQNLIGCIAWQGMDVERNTASKWYVSKDMYSADYYPVYCSGMFVIYSQDVVPLIVRETETTKYFFIDDVFVTGMMAKQLGILHTNLEPLALFFYKKEHLLKFIKDPDSFGDFIFGPPNIPLDLMHKVWNMTQN